MLTHKQSAQLKSMLLRVDDCYPGTVATCILDNSGAILIQYAWSEKVEDEEITMVIASLKRAAAQFGQSARQAEVSAIHIRGQTRMFSCFEINPFFTLAFYSELGSDPLAADLFDTVQADKEMASLLGEMRLVMEANSELSGGQANR